MDKDFDSPHGHRRLADGLLMPYPWDPPHVQDFGLLSLTEVSLKWTCQVSGSHQENRQNASEVHGDKDLGDPHTTSGCLEGGITDPNILGRLKP